VLEASTLPRREAVLVTDFQKTGILVRNMDVTLTGNTITGADATGPFADIQPRTISAMQPGLTRIET